MLDGEIRILFEAALVIIQQPHAFGWFQPIRFDRFINLNFHLPLQFVLVVLNRGQGLRNGGALDDFLDVVTRGFVRVQKDIKSGWRLDCRPWLVPMPIGPG